MLNINKILIRSYVICFALFGSTYSHVSIAQITTGDIAPNFTTTDIQGNTHTLYDYLNQGKTVVIDFSTTWCAPCWGLHETNALKDAYTMYGPNGTDEIVVLWIECDPQTNMDDILGLTSNSQGNWTTGVDYPIIDDATLGGLYGVGAYPTVLYICPNRIATYDFWSNVTTTGIISHAQSCPAPTPGLDASMLSVYGFESNCYGSFDVDCEIFNPATDDVTSATIEILNNGTVIASETWNGTLTSFQSTDITLPNVPNNYSNTNYTTQIVMTGDSDSSNNSISKSVDNTLIESEESITLEIMPDLYPSDIGANIVSSIGDTVLEIFPGQVIGGINTYPVTLSPNECYNFNVTDSYGDGLYSPGYYRIYNNSTGQEILNVPGFDYGIRNSHLISSGFSGIEEKETIASVFPTVTDDILNITVSTSSINHISIFSLDGELIFEQDIFGQKGTLSLGQFDSGMYLVKIHGENEIFHSTKILLK